MFKFFSIYIQPGTSKAYPLFKKEFEENPELAKYFLTKYVYSLTQEKPDGWKEKIKNTLESLPVDGEDLNEKVLHELEYTYRYIVKDKGKAEEYKRKAIAKYPLGIAAQSEAYDEIEQIKPGNVEELKKRS